MGVIVLVGFMGAGKTSVGRLLAARLGVPFVDTDLEVEARARRSIAEIFAENGEIAFRSFEREVVAAALSGPDAVVSVGGGALGDPATRAALEWATVIHLDVSFMEAMRRIADGASERPMLAGDPKALFDERRALYQNAADLVVATDARTADEVAGDIAGRLGVTVRERRVVVGTDPAYPVIIGRELTSRISSIAPPDERVRRVALITHPELAMIAKDVTTSYEDAAYAVSTFDVPSGEGSKDLNVARQLFSAFARAGIQRGDLVAALGGGVICDLAGFVASTYHRGIAAIHIPTTLLAQVDAAIGGKTAVNLPEGKNLVGTFHQPHAVVCDIATLRSLPDREFVSGLAEVVKYGFIQDPGLLDLLERDSASLLARDEDILEEVVARSIAIKAAIVAADEREAGPRALLNYGHTIGHAIEHVRRRDLRHGEAIALGMMAAAYCAYDLGFIDEALVARHRSTLARLGLPVRISVGYDELATLLQRDKKAADGARFVLVRTVGRAEYGIDVPSETIARALARLAR